MFITDIFPVIAGLFGGDGSKDGSPMMGLVFPMVIIGVMIFFMFRGQKKEAAKRRAMMDAIKKDDKVITAGGIVGKVVKVNDDTILLEIEEKVKVELKTTGIAAVVNEEIESGESK
jgi:preprotein translocase subunit YajC